MSLRIILQIWKLENHFPAFFVLPLLVFFSNFNFCVEKKSFCAECFEIVLNDVQISDYEEVQNGINYICNENKNDRII
ncbi:hypothetical protein BpHYR1_047307 [Brachionus plicatilis]|uniref:Uncharacterized protein n=1 Tax=Brachionus plicatilis TaxID=10195 RepID=A0A3M7T0X6_BRAPC|nr:hypothetical protein BpHYR1_047307 [Brachionus plicatilis]